MEDTPQGRQALLDYYGPKGLGLIKSAEDTETVLRTGRLSKAVDPIRAENMLIEAENEMIQRGEPPMVYPTQNDVLHMRQHACATLSIPGLKDERLLKTHDQHEREHWLQRFGVERDMDPLYRPRYEFIMGRGPEPMAPIPPPAAIQTGTPPPQPGQPTPTPQPEQGEQSQTPKPQAASVQPTNGAPAVNMPQNPLTKQPFQPNQPPIEGPPQ